MSWWSYWNIHNCAWDNDCRSHFDPPKRIYFNTPWGMLIVAYRWESRTQLWSPFKGYTQWWSPIVWHPRGK